MSRHFVAGCLKVPTIKKSLLQKQLYSRYQTGLVHSSYIILLQNLFKGYISTIC